MHVDACMVTGMSQCYYKFTSFFSWRGLSKENPFECCLSYATFFIWSGCRQGLCAFPASFTPRHSTRVIFALSHERRLDCGTGVSSMMCSPPWLGFVFMDVTPVTAIQSVCLPLVTSEKFQDLRDFFLFMAHFLILLGCKKFLSLEQDLCRVMASPPSNFCLCKNKSWKKDCKAMR